MKKLVLFAVAMLVSVASFAQKKGDMFIAGSISADCGTQTTSLSDGGYSTSVSQPLSTSFGFGVEYGYFVADNLKLAMAMSVPFSSSPVKEVDGKWLKDTIYKFRADTDTVIPYLKAQMSIALGYFRQTKD